MNAAMMLTEQACAILRANDREGRYTLPTAGLYPFQWNWDASITALGWMSVNEARAWIEIETLFSAQWTARDYGGGQAGFLPHIVFHHESDSYFPGPHEWGTDALSLRTTSISQPPVHATMVRWMLDRAADRTGANAAVKGLLPRLVAHHRWWYRCRDPEGSGLVRCLHPWETGMDNSPAWDSALYEGVVPTSRPYQRRDLDHVDASMRPSMAFYDRVVALMDGNREAGFDPDRMLATCPFQVNDVGIICILQRASRDLALLCDTFGMAAEAAELRERLTLTEAAAPRLWSTQWRQLVSRNALTGVLLDQPTSAGLMAAFAGFKVDDAATIAGLLDETAYAVPSTRASASKVYDAARYWRGPIWQHINLFISTGLAERGDVALAGRIRASSLSLFEHAGFCEYYHPETGEGLGGKAFSWTAATYLYWFSR